MLEETQRTPAAVRQPMIVPPPPRPLPVRQLIMLVLVLTSFYMTALVSGRVFERLPHLEDEVAYLFQARTYARGQLVVETPQPRLSYWQPFLVDREGRRFSKYTPGWPLLLVPGIWFGQPWVVNAFFGMLTVALVYRLGREVFNRDAGVIAAALTTFSPMALLLNGTLMGHTSALFGVTLFMYAYWRLEHGQRPLLWGSSAGVTLGLVAANRPLTAVGVALPFIAWSLARLLRTLVFERRRFLPTFRPLLTISLLGLFVSLLIPIYNYAAVRDPTRNLYTLVWSYDRVGFGECCGRSRDHNLERGFRHMRFDLSMTAADLFGWTIDLRDDKLSLPVFNTEITDHLLLRGSTYPLTGLSWVLLPFALIVGFRWRMLWIVAWLALGYGWLRFPVLYNDGELLRSTGFSYLWVGVAYVWLALPLFVMALRHASRRATWTWLLIGVVVSIIGVQLMYWIGSQRYSTRYYFETLTALALLTALPLGWLARRIGRFVVFWLLVLVIAYSLFLYSIPRVSVLHGFNNIQREHVEAVEARRTSDDPVLLLVTGSEVRWRALGSFMALTSPYLDSDVVVAWDYDNVRDQILARFPDREVIEMAAEGDSAWFVEPADEGG